MYAAIAARALNCRAAVVSAIGRDFRFTSCFEGLDSTCVKAYDMPTTRFLIRYNQQWEAKYVEVNPGVGARIRSSLIPSRFLRPHGLIHLSPMKPTKVARIAHKVRQRSPQAEVSVSTWMGYVEEPRYRRILNRLASEVDFFMLNEFEAKALAQTSSLSLALQRIKAKRLVVTMGKLGAIISGSDVEPQMVPALSVPTNKVVDTTGAGDTWNGAFLAAYKTTGNLMKSVAAASIISSIKCSGWGFEPLLELTFKKPSDVVEYVLALKEGWMQKKLTEFVTYRKGKRRTETA